MLEMHPTAALFEREAWANMRLIEFCAKQPEDVLTGASGDDVMGPVDKQLAHIVSGGAVILPWVTEERWSGEVIADLPVDKLQAPMEWVAERWSRAMDFDRDPEEVYQFQGRRGPVDMTSWKAILQYLHHGDDHRNQIATVLTRHEVVPPELDVWSFGEAVGFERPESAPERRERRDAIVRRAFGHHAWATQTLLAACTELSPEQLAMTATGTYGSILDTLDHMISADRSYLSRLRGTGRKPPLQAGALEPLSEELARTAEGWLSYLDSKPDFDAAIDLRDGTTVGAWVIVAQAIHHGNDHRTHTTTTMMHNGLPIPDLDPWEYSKAVATGQPA